MCWLTGHTTSGLLGVARKFYRGVSLPLHTLPCVFILQNFVNQRITKGRFMVLICIALMTSEIEHVLIVSLAMGFFPSKNTLLISFARFSHCFACLFQTHYRNWILGGLNVSLCWSLSRGSPRPCLGPGSRGAHRTQHTVLQQRFITVILQSKISKEKRVRSRGNGL